MGTLDRRSIQRGLPVLDVHGRRVGSVQLLGPEAFEVRRLFRPRLLATYAQVTAVTADGVHLAVDGAALRPGRVTREDGPATEVVPVATLEQARSDDPERWEGGPPMRPQQDHPATGQD